MSCHSATSPYDKNSCKQVEGVVVEEPDWHKWIAREKLGGGGGHALITIRKNAFYILFWIKNNQYCGNLEELKSPVLFESTKNEIAKMFP